ARRFNRLDPFPGNANDPRSLHKYVYVHGNPINGLDPLGLWSISGVLSSITIGATIGSLVAPAAAVAYLGLQGKISPIKVGENLLKGSTWIGAGAALAGGAVTSAAMSALIQKAGKKFAERAVPIAGTALALYGLYESIKMSWKIATEDLPPSDAEQYVATMVATTILSVAIGAKLKRMAQSGTEHDAAYWNMTPELQQQYQTGQMLLPSKVWNKLVNLGLTGQSLDDIVARGGYLQGAYSRSRRMILAGQGLADALKNHATNPFSSNPGITLMQWLKTGLTPDFRWVFAEHGEVVAASIVATFGFSIDNFLD
ncbi:MAG: hypothetical protein NTY19_26735, partial [Planctomycetota bacterium]|nr:hypothetical protein [Planctomycetota bacterium]